MKIEILAENRTDLMNKLAEVDISVPLRSERRTTDDCERWSICRWLSTYPDFNFPIRLTHRDKPDFILETFDQEIGIEHTEGIHQDYAQASKIAEENNDETIDTLVDMSLFKWGQKREKSEIYEIANRKKLTGPGWEGNSPEIEWAQALYDITQNKTIKLRKDDFKKYKENALLVYDNLPLPHIDYSKATSLFRDALTGYWNSGIIFNKIFVQTDNLLIFISQEEMKTFKTNNVWQTRK